MELERIYKKNTLFITLIGITGFCFGLLDWDSNDVIIKTLIAILLPIVFIYPNIIFVIILLDGVLNPFNTMSHLEMLRKDNDNINLPQKDMVINLAGYVAKMISSYILLNINSDLAIWCMVIVLLISTTLEFKLYKDTSVKEVTSN